MTFCNDRFPSLITLPLYPFVRRFVWCITSLPINRSIYFGHGHGLHEDEGRLSREKAVHEMESKKLHSV